MAKKRPSKTKKSFDNYDKQQLSKFLKKKNYKYVTEKRLQEFYAPPTSNKGLTKKQRIINAEKRSRARNRSRAITRYKKKGNFAITENLAKRTNYISKMQQYIDSDYIFGDNVKELQTLANRGDIFNIEIYKNTPDVKGQSKDLIVRTGSFATAIKKLKESMPTQNNFNVSVWIDNQSNTMVIFINDSYGKN